MNDILIKYRCNNCRISETMFLNDVLDFLSSSGCCPICGDEDFDIFDTEGNIY